VRMGSKGRARHWAAREGVERRSLLRASGPGAPLKRWASRGGTQAKASSFARLGHVAWALF